MVKSPTRGHLSEAEIDPKLRSAQYWEDEKKRARQARAATEIRRRIEAGELDPQDEKSAKSQIADLLKQYEEEDMRVSGAAEMGRLATSPDVDPKTVYGYQTQAPDVAPLSQKEKDEQDFALAISKTHAAREREKELAAIKGAETPELPGSGAEHRIGSTKPGEDILDFARQPISRPGWNTKIRAYVDRETGKINPRYFLWKPEGSKSMEVMKPDVQTKLEKLLNHPQHGRLLTMMHLKADPQYVVQIFKGERGPIALGFKMARGERPQRIASGELIKVQKTLEDAAGVAPAEEHEPFHFGATTAKPSAEDKPEAPGLVPPEGGWQDFDPEVVNDITYDEASGEPLAWGDFWRSKSADEIAHLPIDPREIDPKMGEDPQLDDEQRSALRAKIASARIPPKSESDRKHFQPRPDMTGQKTIDVIDPRTGKKYREKVTDWETPAMPGGAEMSPILTQKRDEIKSIVPSLKTVIDKFGKDAKFKLKRTDDVVGWRVSYDREGGATEVDLGKAPEPGEIEASEKCGKCGHTSGEHAAGVYSCQHPDCQAEKEFKGGKKMKISTCPHFVGSGKKTGKKKRVEQTWDADAAKSFLDELSDLPSEFGGEKGGEEAKRITDVVGALDTYLDAVRKAAWGKLRQEKVQEFAKALFGDSAASSDPKVASVARNLADEVVFGARGGGPDWDDNRRMPWSTSRTTPGNWHRRAEEIQQVKGARGESLSLFDKAILRLAQFPEKGPGSLYNIAAGMRNKYDEASEKLRNEMSESESAITLVKKLARELRAASTKGKSADAAMGLEKVGSKVRWSNEPKVRKKGGKEFRLAQPVDPTVRKSPEASAGGEAEMEADKAAARAERFKGTPKFRGSERPRPEVIPATLPQATPVPAGQAYRRDDEMMADDPVSRHRREEDQWLSNLRPSARPKIRQEQKTFDNWLNQMLEHAHADYSPSWWDDIE